MTVQVAALYDPKMRQLACRGDWDLQNIPQLKIVFNSVPWPTTGEVIIDGADIQKMDSAGAWLICKLQTQLEQHGITVSLQKFSHEYQRLLSIIQRNLKKEAEFHPETKKISWVAQIGKNTWEEVKEVQAYLTFIGSLTFEALRIAAQPKHLRWSALANIIYRTGFQALPIISLLSFMIGVVLAYQMGLQLRNYGANIYIVDLMGIAVLREFGPLLTAIMVAGRTGSAFTAQLGMMKINQEIDALNTLGVTPAELLLLPRIAGLFIALPLLSIWSDIFGVFGGMIMSNNMLNITFYDFLNRFSHVVKLKTLLLGLVKTPVFALIIATIGCFEGMQVKVSAESVGRNTTRSVVLAIFFIIVADAAFSILFSKLNL